ELAHRPKFECRNERWPFQAGADKVISVVHAITSAQEPQCAYTRACLTACYTNEYYLELIFQRFFAWVAYEAAPQTERLDWPTHFQYRNAYANARAVLAMPLLVDLSRELGAIVG